MHHPCNNATCPVCRDRDLDRAEEPGNVRTLYERLPSRPATEAEREGFDDNITVLICCEDRNGRA
jgi:hypothetical protein